MSHVVSTGLGLEIPSDQFLTSEPPPRELTNLNKGVHHEDAYNPNNHWPYGLSHQFLAAEGAGGLLHHHMPVWHLHYLWP